MNGVNVVKVGHKQVVSLIRQGGNHLVMKVVSVSRKPESEEVVRKKGRCGVSWFSEWGLRRLNVSRRAEARGSAGRSPAWVDGHEAAELQLVQKEGTARGRPTHPSTATSAYAALPHRDAQAAAAGSGAGGMRMVVRWRGCSRALPLMLGKPGTASGSVLTPELCVLSKGWSWLLVGDRAASGACSPWCQRQAVLESRDSPCPEGGHGG